MKPDILRQRRNLIGISIALSLYYLAGGGFSKSSLFFGVVEFEKPEIILFLAHCSLVYFLWRYWLHLKPIRSLKGISRNKNAIYQDERHYLCNLQYELATDKSYLELAKKSLEGGDHKGINQFTPFLVRDLFKRKLDFSYLSPTKGNTGSISQRPEICIPFLSVFIIEVRCQFKTIIKHTSFTDYVLPYWISLAPVLIWVSRNI